MRRIFFILLSLFTLLPLSAQQTQDALYIFRNDGKFNGFFYDDIEKIEFSRIDTLGVEHQDYVVQEVYALDSIFRIPINAIDSVSFVTPETVYKKDVINTTSDLWNYVIGSDSVSWILLSPQTPAALIPMVGDKLACTKSREWLPGGFFGKVRSVSNGANGTTVVCEPVNLTELFDQYVTKGGLEGESDDQAEFSSRRAPKKKNPAWKYFTIPVSVAHIDMGDISYAQDDFEGSGSVDCGFMGDLSVRAFLQTNAIAGYVYYDLNIRCENRLWFNAKATISGSADLKTDPFWRRLEWIPDTPFCILMEAGGKIGVSGKVSAEIHRYISNSVTATAQYNHDWKNDVYQTMGHTGFRWLANEFKYNLSGNFALTAGPYFDVKFTTPAYLISDKAGAVTLTIEGGSKLDVTGEIVSDQTYQNASTIGSESTIFYDIFNRDGALKLGPYLAGSFEASIGNWKFKKDLFDVNLTLDFEGALVPKFSDVGVNYNSRLNADVAHASISRNILLMSPVGFAVYDSNNKRVGENRWFDTQYYMENFIRYSMKLDGLEKGKEYTLVPLVKLFDKYDIIGRPWGKFTAQAEPEKPDDPGTEGQELTITPEQLSFNASGGSHEITITVNGSDGKFTLLPLSIHYDGGETGWLSCSVGNFTATGDVKYTITAKENTMPQHRMATIKIVIIKKDGEELQGEVKVIQDFVIYPKLELSTSEVSMGNRKSSVTINVDTDTEQVKCSKNVGWISASYDKETRQLTIEVEDNDTEGVRSGIVTVKASNNNASVERQITVTQAGLPKESPLYVKHLEIVLSPSLKLPSGGGGFYHTFSVIDNREDPDETVVGTHFMESGVDSVYFVISGVNEQYGSTYTITSGGRKVPYYDGLGNVHYYYEFSELTGHVVHSHVIEWVWDASYQVYVDYKVECEFDFSIPYRKDLSHTGEYKGELSWESITPVEVSQGKTGNELIITNFTGTYSALTEPFVGKEYYTNSPLYFESLYSYGEVSIEYSSEEADKNK